MANLHTAALSRRRRKIVRLSRRTMRSARFELLERRLCLSTLYEFDVIAREGQLGLVGMGMGPSINDSGSVAFVGKLPDGADGLFVGDGTRAPQRFDLDPLYTGPGRTYGQAIEMNNDRHVVAVDRASIGGTTEWALRRWNANHFTGDHVVYARASTPRTLASDFDAISSYAALAQDGGIAFAGLNDSMWELRYTTSPLGVGEEVATLTAPQSLRPAIVAGGTIVARIGPHNDVSDPLLLYRPGAPPVLVAGDANGFAEAGRAAGISGDGSVVAFYGSKSGGPDPGPGVFARLVDATGTVHHLRLAGLSGNGVLDPGETFTDVNHNGQFDPGEMDAGPFQAFDPLGRVATNGSTAVFLATNTSNQEALFTVTFGYPTDTQGTSEPQVTQVTEVVRVGGQISLAGDVFTIEDLNLNDPINAGGQLVFWAQTDKGQAVFRANELLRPVLFLPGIVGTFSSAVRFEDWLMQRGFPPEHLVLEPLTRSYHDLMESLENAGYVRDRNLFAALYDWRVPPAPQSHGVYDGRVTGLTVAGITDATFEYAVDYVGYWLLKAVEAWSVRHPDVPLDSVDVIAHSTGGLVARSYIQSNVYNGLLPASVGATSRLPKVNHLLLVGVPNQGASKAFNALQDNWMMGLTLDDRIPYILLSKVFKLAHQKLVAGETITGPRSTDRIRLADVSPGGAFDARLFIQTYVPTIRALLATYDFLEVGGQLLNVNNDPKLRNDWVLDLNGGADTNGFADLVIQPPTVLYSTNQPTATRVAGHMGPLSLAPTIHEFRSSLPRIPDDMEWWHADVAGPDGGDGTVPTISSVGLYRNDARFRTLEFARGNVTHQGLTGNPDVQRAILDWLGRPAATPLATRHAIQLDPVYGKLIMMGVDPVDALLIDDQGRRLGYTQATGPLNEIPDSVYYGGAVGFGLLYGSDPVPSRLELTGAGGAYAVFLDGYVRGTPRGVTDSGTLAAGERKVITLDFNPPPPTRPQVTAVTLLDQPAPNQLRLAIDFSVPMSAPSVEAVEHYAVSRFGSVGLAVLSAAYVDDPDQPRVVLTVQGGDSLPSGEYVVRLNGRQVRSAAGIPVSTSGDQAVVLVSSQNAMVTVGTFSGTDSVGALNTSSLGFGTPSSMISQDITGDGILDLVTTSYQGEELGSRMLFFRGLGAGQFARPVPYALDPWFQAVRVDTTDWNGDGHPDILVGATKTYYWEPFEELIYVFLNDGTGDLVHAPETPIPVTHTSNFQVPVTRSLVVADLLPSPGPEIVAYKQGYHNVYGGIPDQPGEIQIIGKDPFLGYGPIMVLPLNVPMSFGEYSFADFNGDGRLDILATATSVVLIASSGESGFAPAREIEFDRLPNFGVAHPGLGDVDGDGHLDIVLVHEQYSNWEGVRDGSVITLLKGDGTGQFTQDSRTLMHRRGSSLVELKDMTGDGLLDLFVAEGWNDGPGGWPDVSGVSIWVWPGDGQGRFATPAGQPALVSRDAASFASHVVTDLDGDSDLDGYFTLDGSPKLWAMINDSQGQFAAPGDDPLFFGSVSTGGSTYQPSMFLGDFNRDGLADIARAAESRVELMWGEPGGGFRPGDSVLVHRDGSVVDGVQGGDLNGDGILDLVLSGHALVVLVGQGDGTFQTPALYAGRYIYDLHLADANHDGHLDALVVLSEGNGYFYGVFFGDGSGKLYYNANTVRPHYSTQMAVADFDGDGRVDILRPSDYQFQVLRGNGNGTFAPQATQDATVYASAWKAADMDHDGDVDIVGLDHASGWFYAYLNDGMGQFSESAAVDVGSFTHTLNVGDYNADGKPDVGIVVAANTVFGGDPRRSLLYLPGDGRGGFGPVVRIDVGGLTSHAIATLRGEAFVSVGSTFVVQPSMIQFESGALSAVESAGSLLVYVTRTGDQGAEVTVDYAVTGGTATPGVDYVLTAGTLTFLVGQTSAAFALTLLDDSQMDAAETIVIALDQVSGPGASLGSPAVLTISILDDEAAWRNPANRFDVNRDTFVSPRDALIIINDLNVFGTRLLPPPDSVRFPPPFVDVSGDNYISPIDALQVINYINKGDGTGEGENERVRIVGPVPGYDPAGNGASRGRPAVVRTQVQHRAVEEDHAMCASLDLLFARWGTTIPREMAEPAAQCDDATHRTEGPSDVDAFWEQVLGGEADWL